MDHFEVGDRVKLKVEYKKLRGKEGVVSNVDKWECGVKVDGHTFLIHKKSLTNLTKSS